MKVKNYSFDNNFEVFLADTPESREIHYNIRYQVYCDEMGFEDKTNFPDCLEKDNWDDQSVHFIVKDNHNGHWIAALRLVFSKKNTLPFVQHAGLDNEIEQFELRNSAELSRLCVIKEVRRFSAKRFAPLGLLEDEMLKADNPKVTVLQNYKNLGLTLMWGLIRAASLYAKENGIEDLYLLVTPALAFSIQKEGFCLTQFSTPCEHRGKRIPFQWKTSNVLNSYFWDIDYKNGFNRFSDIYQDQDTYQKFA